MKIYRFSQEARQDKRKYIFQMLQEKYGQPRMLNTMSIALTNESEIKNPLRFPKKKEKLRRGKMLTSMHLIYHRKGREQNK